MRCREGESHAKVAQMGSHRGRSKPQIPSLKHGLLFSLYGIASFHLCVIEYSNFCHLSANHYFLEPCSEKRSYSVLSTKTPEFIISSYIGGCMVEIKLTDVLLPSETIEVKHFNMLRVPSPRWGIILWSSSSPSLCLHRHQYSLAQEQGIFQGTPELPSSHRWTVWAGPEKGWFDGSSSGCSRLFGRATWMQCSPGTARAQSLPLPCSLSPELGENDAWALEESLEQACECMWLLFNLQSILSIRLLLHSIFAFSLVISTSLKLCKSMICTPFFMLGNQGLQFAIWRIEKK